MENLKRKRDKRKHKIIENREQQMEKKSNIMKKETLKSKACLKEIKALYKSVNYEYVDTTYMDNLEILDKNMLV